MVLKTDVSGSRKILQRPIELVRRAVRVLADLGPLIEVRFGHELPVHLNRNSTAPTRDHVPIPAVGLERVGLGRNQVIQAADAVLGQTPTGSRARDLDFNAGVHRIVQIRRADEDPAVGPAGHLEFQFENEIAVRMGRPQIVVIVLRPIGPALQRNDAVFHGPVRGRLPVAQILAVEQHGKAFGIRL